MWALVRAARGRQEAHAGPGRCCRLRPLAVSRPWSNLAAACITSPLAAGPSEGRRRDCNSNKLLFARSLGEWHGLLRIHRVTIRASSRGTDVHESIVKFKKRASLDLSPHGMEEMNLC